MSKFKDAKFMTAEEKRLTLKAWSTFIKHGFQFEHFSKRLYHHLMQHCSFIAHYNRGGFYQEYFERSEDTLKFLTQFDLALGCVSVEYGYSGWYTDSDYSDLAEAMVNELAPKLVSIRSKLTGQAVTDADNEVLAAIDKSKQLRAAQLEACQ